MKPLHVAAALALGGFLAATPFLRYAHPGASLAPHADHRARHGGTLQMIGDHHVELVRTPGRIEVFVSDALRAPVRPAEGSARFGERAPVSMQWGNHRLWAPRPEGAEAVEIDVRLEAGERLAWRFPPE